MTVNDLVGKLGHKGSRGSKPRCHLITHGKRSDVANYLTDLTDGAAKVTPGDRWMPAGFDDIAEVELHKKNDLIDPEQQALLAKWWLPAKYLKRRTPNLDIASTCTIGGKRGLILVEAKAHHSELDGEAKGRPISRKRRKGREDVPATPEEIQYRTASNRTIGKAIKNARDGLTRDTGLEWGISRDTCYQMSNRFAWSWKLTDLGVPVVLVYLGFLNAADDIKKATPFKSAAEWEAAVREHSVRIVPQSIWGKKLKSNNETFVAMIQARTCYRPA